MVKTMFSKGIKKKQQQHRSCGQECGLRSVCTQVLTDHSPHSTMLKGLILHQQPRRLEIAR